jgi:hypothetical protein
LIDRQAENRPTALLTSRAFWFSFFSFSAAHPAEDAGD